jgi:hypothetical protein
MGSRQQLRDSEQSLQLLDKFLAALTVGRLRRMFLYVKSAISRLIY